MTNNDPLAQLMGLTIPDDDTPYFAAIGRFITTYAMAEHQVHVLARKLSRMSDAKGRIVFSGMRLGDLADRIRGLLRTTGASKKRYDEIDRCLRQLDLIATQRNNLVHRFVRYSSGKITVTNVVISKSIETHEQDVYGLQHFEDMDLDCTAITLRLAKICGTNINLPSRKWMHQPWRYKPVPRQTKQKQPPQRTAQPPLHQRQSSTDSE